MPLSFLLLFLLVYLIVIYFLTGSVKVTFDVLHEKHQSDQLVSDLKSDISSGLNFKFKAKALKTVKTLSVDGKSVAVISKAESKSNTAVIAAVVVVVLLLIIVGVVLVYVCHYKVGLDTLFLFLSR